MGRAEGRTERMAQDGLNEKRRGLKGRGKSGRGTENNVELNKNQYK